MRTACLLLLATLCGCWGSSSYIPILIAVQPGNSSFTFAIATGTTRIYVFGFYLTPETVIQWNGRPQKTTFVGQTAPGFTAAQFGDSAAAVQVDLDADLTKVAGTGRVTASTGGGPFSDFIDAPIVDAAFTFGAVSPTQLDANAPGATLTLTGTGFRADTQVFLDGNPLAVTFVSSTSITAQVPATQLVNPGERLLQLLQVPCTGGDQSFCDGVVERTAISAIVSVGSLGTRKLVNGPAQDLVWDATDSLLFATIQPGATAGSSQTSVLASIDPATGAVGASEVPMELQSGTTISAGDQFIYTLSNSARQIRRLALPGLTSPTTVATPQIIGALAPAPDAAQTLAYAGLPSAIVDGTVQRPSIDQSSTAFSARSLSWGANDTILFGLANSTLGLLVFHVDSTGITSLSTLATTPFNGSSTLLFDRVTGRLYGSGGENYDAQGGDARPFLAAATATPLGGSKVAIDSGHAKAFFAGQEGSVMTVRSFDLGTQKFISRIVLAPGPAPGGFGLPGPTRMVRWGTNGLAVATTAGVYLYSGPFVH